VLRNDEPVDLTGAEFDILPLLIRSAGNVLSRDEIAESALGRRVGVLDRRIDNHISNLGKKLGYYVDGIERIGNMRGIGYVYTGESN
jgi:two-component system response regulator CpxR